MPRNVLQNDFPSSHKKLFVFKPSFIILKSKDTIALTELFLLFCMVNFIKTWAYIKNNKIGNLS